MTSRTLELSRVTFRELHDSADGSLTFTGLAVPYNIPTDLGHYREQFAPGSVDPAALIGIPLLWRHGEPIGLITAAQDTPAGPEITGRILPTTTGRDAAVLVREDAVSGLSVGFTFDPVTSPIVDGLQTHQAVVIREISLTPLPQYAAAAITEHREERNMETAVSEAPSSAVATREDLDALESRLLAGAAAPNSEPISERELWTAYREGLSGNTDSIEIVRRALADTVLSGSPGLAPVPNLARVRGALTRGRPTAEAFGIESLPGYGMSVDIPVITADPVTGNQTAEKAEAPSGAFTVGSIPATVFTEAGATDVSRQFIDRSSPEGLPLLMSRFVEIYSRRYNSRVLAVAATTTKVVSLPSYRTDDVGGALAEAAALVTSAILTAPSFVAAAPDVFFGIAMASGNGYPVAGGNVGMADLASLRFTVAGLSVVCDPGIPAGIAYMSAGNGEALTCLESPGAPFTLEADNVGRIGRDVAVYGYGAIAAVEIDGVVKLDTSAP